MPTCRDPMYQMTCTSSFGCEVPWTLRGALPHGLQEDISRSDLSRVGSFSSYGVLRVYMCFIYTCNYACTQIVTLTQLTLLPC